jgi:glycosyltransferase involved in cell wall biosynthesis
MNIKKIRLFHIITSLSTGGAEMMLYKLLSAMDRSRFESSVISLVDKGIIGARIESLGVPVYSAGMRRGLPTPLSVWRLRQLVSQLQTDLIQGWMYHGNLAATLAPYLVNCPKIPVIWNVRHSVYDLVYEKRLTRSVIRLGAKLSSQERYIIYNSKTSALQHESLGYCSDRTTIVPNGFDCELFCPSEDARFKLRRQLGIDDTTSLIGLISRYHPMKDHANFLRAMAEPELHNAGINAVLVGRGVDDGNSELMGTIRSLGLEERVHLLGERKDIPEIMAGLNVAASSSYGEGFPNVIGEAMACGVPCVVTDVGDSCWVVGETGRVVPPRSPKALAKACASLLEMPEYERRKLGERARKRILENFSLEAIVKQYERIYEEALFDGKE